MVCFLQGTLQNKTHTSMLSFVTTPAKLQESQFSQPTEVQVKRGAGCTQDWKAHAIRSGVGMREEAQLTKKSVFDFQA